MILFIIIAILLIAGGVFLYLDEKTSSYTEGYAISGWTLLFFGIIGLFALLITTAAFYTTQIDNLEELDSIDDRIVLAETRAEEQEEIIRAELIENYPDFELEIIDNIDDPEILLSYPQLRSSETVRDAVNKITELDGRVYDLENDRISYETDIRKINRNPWVIEFLIPDE